jgi:PhoPQ-activated pathogenicity-related protein
MLEIQKIEDPYYYFERRTMPKLIVNAVGDEFQAPDDTSLWWEDLPEPKRFMMVPYAEHSMATGMLEIVPAIGAWMVGRECRRGGRRQLRCYLRFSQ